MPLLEKGLVLSNHKVAEGLYEMEFAAPKMTAMCSPGQFVNIKISNNSDPLLRRPLSLYDVNHKQGIISLLYKVVGKGTQNLTETKVRDYVDIMGPLGKGFTIPENKQNIVLVGGGVGIAPLVYLARALSERKCKVQVLYGVENRQQLAALSKFMELGALCMPATVDGSAGFKGMVTGILTGKLDPSGIDAIYACGPEVMMAEVAAFARAHSIWGEVSLEEHMACGVGACLGCARQMNSSDQAYAKICKDGPVFNLAQTNVFC